MSCCILSRYFLSTLFFFRTLQPALSNLHHLCVPISSANLDSLLPLTLVMSTLIIVLVTVLLTHNRLWRNWCVPSPYLPFPHYSNWKNCKFKIENQNVRLNIVTYDRVPNRIFKGGNILIIQ